jgi:hypothetical protein
MHFTLTRQKNAPRVYPVYYMRYLDQLIWLLKRKPVRWTPEGRLCHIIPMGKSFYAVECHTHFPGWWISLNIRLKYGSQLALRFYALYLINKAKDVIAWLKHKL